MKRLLLGLLVFCLVLPATVFAGGYEVPTADELLQKIEQLSRELAAVKQQLRDVKAQQGEIAATKGEISAVKRQLQDVKAKQTQTMQAVDQMSGQVAKADPNSITRFKVWGDYRFRADSTRVHQPRYWDATTIIGALDTMAGFSGNDLSGALSPLMPALSPELQAQFGTVLAGWDGLSTTQRIQTLNQMLPALGPDLRTAMMQDLLGLSPSHHNNADNDLLYTSRVRLNAKVKPSENLTFKARLAMYKLWGNDSDFVSAGGGMFPSNLFAHNMTFGIRPSNNTVYVDRAYVNWSNIADLPIWFSVGRRPTTHTVPKQLREGLEKRDASPFGANIDIPFDGATVGYQYSDPVPGRIRFCYGRGFESGFKGLTEGSKIDDVDFYGFVWDVVDDPDENLLVILQAFKAADIFDFPEGKLFVNDPTLPFGVQQVTSVPKSNLGDIYELGGVVQHKFRGINWFASLGVSISDPKARSRGMFDGIQNDPTLDPFEGVSILTDPADSELKDRTGWSVYLGARFPLDSLNSKLGIEYNYGSKNWLPFMVASDDIYMDKLSTRGQVAEAYWIWDLPEVALSKYAKAFVRAGYQYYWFDYTGSANWLGSPVDIDDLTNDPLNAQFFRPVERMDNFYLTFDVYF